MTEAADPRPASVRAVLRVPLLAGAAVVAGLLGLVLTFAYVGAFVNPVGHLDRLPVGVVDLDQPAAVAGQELAIGSRFVEALRQSADTAVDGRTPVAIEVFATEAEARAALGDNRVAGVIIIPADLSERIGALATSLGAGDPAQLSLLRNAGAGSLQPAVFDLFASSAVDRLSDTVAAQVGTAIAALGVPVDPTAAPTLGRPIVAVTADVPDIGDHGGRGLPPFYVAVMATLTGVLAATALHVAIGSMAGTTHTELLGRPVHLPAVALDRRGRWLAEVLLAVPAAVVGGAAVVWMAVGLLGAHADRPFHATVLSIGAVLSTMWLAQAFLAAFGLVGDLAVLMITTIFGVPSARGVYPAEALPGLFRWLGEVLPLRWITDGMRATFFYDARLDAGLGGACGAVVAYALVGLAGGAVAVAVCDARAGRPLRRSTDGAAQAATPRTGTAPSAGAAASEATAASEGRLASAESVGPDAPAAAPPSEAQVSTPPPAEPGGRRGPLVAPGRPGVEGPDLAEPVREPADPDR